MKNLVLVLAVLFTSVGVRAQDASAPAAAPSTPAATPAPETIVSAPAFIGKLAGLGDDVRFILNDFKKNTRFKIDSTVPLTEYDWKHGQWSAGSAIPFLNEGSYLWTGGELTKSLSDPNRIGKAGLVEGVRLNDVTRPATQFVLSKVFQLDLQKHTMLDFLAKSTSAGVTGGHDFNSPDMKKVIINSWTMFFGLEMAFGPDPSAPAAQSVKSRKVYFR